MDSVVDKYSGELVKERERGFPKVGLFSLSLLWPNGQAWYMAATICRICTPDTDTVRIHMQKDLLPPLSVKLYQ